MTNQEIVEQLCKDKTVEQIAKNIRVTSDFFDDFVSEMYMILLTYDNDKLNEMYNNKQLKFFTARIAMNNWNSHTSPFWTKYKKPLEHENKNVTLERLADTI